MPHNLTARELNRFWTQKAIVISELLQFLQLVVPRVPQFVVLEQEDVAVRRIVRVQTDRAVFAAVFASKLLCQLRDIADHQVVDVVNHQLGMFEHLEHCHLHEVDQVRDALGMQCVRATPLRSKALRADGASCRCLARQSEGVATRPRTTRVDTDVRNGFDFPTTRLVGTSGAAPRWVSFPCGLGTAQLAAVLDLNGVQRLVLGEQAKVPNLTTLLVGGQ